MMERWGTKCREDDCITLASVRGWCKKHYNTHKNNPTGSKNQNGPKPFLNTEQCKAIKKRSSQFVSNQKIAEEFGTTADTIRRVLNGKYTPNDKED
jgi:DNA invertase Pin-like site-specific DNA recombinase